MLRSLHVCQPFAKLREVSAEFLGVFWAESLAAFEGEFEPLCPSWLT